MAQIAVKGPRRTYPIVKPGEDMPDSPEFRAKAQMFGVLGDIALGIGQRLQDKRTQFEYTEGKALWTERHGEFIRGLRDDPDYKNYPVKYNKFNAGLQGELLSKGYTSQATNGLKNYMVEQTANQAKLVAGISVHKEVDYMRASTLNAVSTHILNGEAAAAKSALIRGRNAGYFSAEEIEKRIQTIDVETDWNLGIQSLQAAPERFLKEIEDKDFLPNLDAESRLQLKSSARQGIAAKKRELAEQRQLIQEQTASQFLADYWDKKLIDPQVITNAVRSGLIKDTDAKYLMGALLNPEPPTLNLSKLAEVKEAITDIGTGAKTRSEALEILYKNLEGIDPTTGKSLVAEIFAEHDKGDAEMKREGRNLMEDLIRDKELMSGYFTDDERQILGTSEAILMLESAIEKAAKDKKPLTRRDILIRAVEIGRQIKNKIKREEADAVPPEFIPETEGYPTAPRAPDITAKGKPIIKGALSKPDFVLDSEGEPEKVFDSEGREVGLRRKSGAIFRIGFHAILNGKKYEYVGNGNWKLVK